MTAQECHDRASACVTSADLAKNESVSMEFMRLAAYWRALATRVINLGSKDKPAEALSSPSRSLKTPT